MATVVNPLELLGGLALSLVIGWVGYRRGALSRSGVLGALICGALIFGLGGWEWGVLLVVFFISSSGLSFYRARDKERLAEKFAKGHRRDLGQALANGGLAAALAIASLIWPHPLWYFGCIGAMAAVNADTWATELGVLSRRLPRLVTSGEAVEPGTSGAISGVGSAAALGGSLLIGLVAAAAPLALGNGLGAAGAALLAALLGGVAGSFADSLMGATGQAMYWCDACGKETERRVHRCGTRTRHWRGARWLGNDLVNAIASAVGALVAAGVGNLLM
jgi:uncharacterized protein (TIGR00297 family)